MNTRLCSKWLRHGLVTVLLLSGYGRLAALDLREAKVFVSPNASVPEKKAVDMLVDEVFKKTRLTLGKVSEWPKESRTIIAIGVGANPDGIPSRYLDGLLPAPTGPEGYRVQADQHVVMVVGNSPVAAVFGVGYLLRHLRMDADPMTNGSTLETMDPLRVATSPHHGIRGFQFNYRDWTNSYDGWTPAMFEQYVRDVAVFGANSIELLGPGPDNERESPHFPLAKSDMLVEMSRITAEYGLKVWLFLPVWGPTANAGGTVRDYTKAADVQSALDEWGEVFRRMPQLDAVFVPGGDPGNTEPKQLMPLLEKQAANLRRYHPNAEMWVSPQEFSKEWMDEFLDILKKEPSWLNGVAYGPWTRLTLPELREKVPARYPIRLYPDVTHSIYCEYPVLDWDPAFMFTEGREPSNPRPTDMAKIFHYADPYNVGTLLYSEGINDDVNKFVFSGLDWDAGADVKQLMREYARYFFGYKYEESAANGIFGLEDNWRGALLTNGSVDQTFLKFREMERSAPPRLLLDWRFQHLLYRAYYDYYIKLRLTHETALEQQAMDKLRTASELGSVVAMNEATRILEEGVTQPVGVDIRMRLRELGAAMFQSIRSQLSVDRYQALSVDRGASLDSMDTPLNQRYWLISRFAEIRQLPDELSRLTAIEKIINRTNPGPGGYYDDLGNPANQPHLEGVLPLEQDPGRLRSPHNSRAAFTQRPMRSVDAIRADGPAQVLSFPTAWWTLEETRWDTPMILHYRDLDKSALYKVRVVYYGWSKRNSRIRLIANEGTEIHPYLKKPSLFSEMEFDIPAAATSNGELRLRWEAEPGGTWAGVMVSEVLLLRR